MKRGPSVGTNRRGSSVDKVRRTWKGAAPAWVLQLAGHCDEISQRQIAARLNCSEAQISQVLGNKYGASLDAFESKVRAILINAEMRACPILGEISAGVCYRHQQAKFSTANPQAVALYSACKACPNARSKS